MLLGVIRTVQDIHKTAEVLMDSFEFMQRNGVDFFCADIEDDTYDNVEFQPEGGLAGDSEETSSQYVNKSEVL